MSGVSGGRQTRFCLNSIITTENHEAGGVPDEMTIIVRKTGSEDMSFLREMLYEAIFIPEGEEKPHPSIIDNPDIYKYLSGWMKKTDTGFIAEADGRAVGAAWARLFESAAAGGYGFINSDTPELCLAVYENYRNRGVGTALMNSLLAELKLRRYEHLSLSVDKQNRAVDLYKRLGFKVVKEQDTDYLMLKKL